MRTRITLLASLTALLLPLVSFAGFFNTHSPFTALFISGNAGIDQSHIRDGSRANYNVQGGQQIGGGFTYGLDGTTVSKNQNLQAQFGVGFGAVFLKHFYLGVLPYLQFGNASTVLGERVNFVGSTTSLSKQVDIHENALSGGINIEPGFVVNAHTLLYAIIGWAERSASMNSTDFINEDSTGFTNRFVLHTHKTFNGLNLGFGLTEMINRYLALNFVYTYTNFGHLSLRASRATTIGPIFNPTSTLSTTNSRIKLTNNSVLIGLSYLFNHTQNKAFTTIISNPMWSGLFLGFQLGVLDNLFRHVNSLYSIQNAGITTNLNPQSTFGINSAVANVLLGYGLRFHHVYLAAQAFISEADHQGMETTTFSDASGDNNLANTVTLKQNGTSFGIDVTPGLLLTQNTLLFLRIGGVTNDTQLTSTTSSAGFATPMVLNTYRELNGLRLGFGLQQLITRKVGITLNYLYTNFGQITLSGSRTAAGATQSASTRLSLHNAMFTIGVIYHLGTL